MKHCELDKRTISASLVTKFQCSEHPEFVQVYAPGVEPVFPPYHLTDEENENLGVTDDQ